MKGGDYMDCGGTSTTSSTSSAGTDSYTINVDSFDWSI